MKKCRGIEIDSRSSSITQILALTYGLICILLALMALSAASIIQASLIVFSVVGGPMLAVFTLGMFTLSANQKVPKFECFHFFFYIYIPTYYSY